MDFNITNSSIKNSSWLKAWTKKFCNATHLYQAGIYKRSGYSAHQLISSSAHQLFLTLPFTNNKIYRFSGRGKYPS